VLALGVGSPGLGVLVGIIGIGPIPHPEPVAVLERDRIRDPAAVRGTVGPDRHLAPGRLVEATLDPVRAVEPARVEKELAVAPGVQDRRPVLTDAARGYGERQQRQGEHSVHLRYLSSITGFSPRDRRPRSPTAPRTEA